MQIRSALVLLALLACRAPATVSVDLYPPDGNTPLALRDPNKPHVYQDVMVGTELRLIISSDSGNAQVNGKVRLPLDEAWKGNLTARDYNDVTTNYDGSCLPAAGAEASVSFQISTSGYLFRSDGRTARAGQWFVWDYEAIAVGPATVNVEVTDLAISPIKVGLSLSVNQVLSRDFNNDTTVNFRDFALFARQWRTKPGSDPNGLSTSFDLDADANVDVSDLGLFSKFWLARTTVKPPISDPNTPSPSPASF